MRIGIIGCGYVFDLYMATLERHPHIVLAGVFDRDPDRLAAVAEYYGVDTYSSNEALCADPDVDIVVNFTSIESHYDVTRMALEAGKHVYSEKPLVTDMDRARELVDIAEQRGLWLSCAPSYALSATAQTMWKAVEDGAIGDVRLVYAEYDDNPIYLMNPEGWRSRSGAPWPYRHEYEMGCTVEHVGYHLNWMCAVFGPVKSVTAFSKHVIPDKTDLHLDPDDTPDFSVACLDFESGVVGRITCSIAVPYDLRMRIIGNRGMVHTDTHRHYECPVYLEPFTKLNLNARKSRSVRNNTLLQWPFRIGGRRIPLVRTPPPGASDSVDLDRAGWGPRSLLGRVKRNEVGQEDKCIGIAELVDAVETGRAPFPSHDFTLHATELTLAIQNAGTVGSTYEMTTSFEPLEIPGRTVEAAPNYAKFAKRGLLDRMSEGLIDRLHRH